MKNQILLTGVFASLSIFAQPRVDQNAVTFTQAPGNNRVTINYVLTGEPGIITVDIQTNYLDGAETKWASIGDENFSNVAGDVNKLVTEVGTTRTICWRPHVSWPNHEITGGGIRAVVRAWSKADPPDYLVCDLIKQGVLNYYASEKALPGGVTNKLYKTDCLLLRRIPAAGVTWWMGAPSGEVGQKTVASWGGIVDTSTREKLHQVTLTNDFYIGVYEITERQWWLTKYNTSYTYDGEGLRPVCNISWYACRGSASNWPSTHDVVAGSALGIFSSMTGVDFDLPTSAQWEFACRAGTGTALNSGKNLSTWQGDDNDIGAVGWYKDNSDGVVHDVGGKPANGFGLYDMHGNAFEWTLDWYATENSTDSEIEPVGPTAGRYRILRGGAATEVGGFARSAYTVGREGSFPNPCDGARLVAPISLKW